MFKPLVIGSRMELVSKKSLRNNEERITSVNINFVIFEFIIIILLIF